MRQLAEFEGYAAALHVTENDLVRHGFGERPSFGAFVAQLDDALVGLAVHYEIPWPFDMRPVVVLKELFVVEAARGSGVGASLFDRVAEHASARGASILRWTALPDNHDAKKFYTSRGGRLDKNWETWEMRLR
ncbi:GNAT family N-acetyltransferase [Agrobacterium pusense]|nr:GNAT family N-acetyltransferase [Agrobacterium pusense]OOO19700.1 hypothetical protein BTE56_13330 [Agrobacterium pusense]WKD47927.1 GNAT family N-acetyltransferase [Agrobacterium pusense]